jgi:hypothetical protein
VILGETLTLLRRGKVATDTDGNDRYPFVSVPVPGCAFSNGGSAELVQGRDIVISQPTAYMPPGVVVTPYDRVIARGDTYEVDGSPNADVSPFTGWAPGVVVKLKRVTG